MVWWSAQNWVGIELGDVMEATELTSTLSSTAGVEATHPQVSVATASWSWKSLEYGEALFVF